MQVLIIIIFCNAILLIFLEIGQSLSVKLTDSDIVKCFIKDHINRFHEMSTDTKGLHTKPSLHITVKHITKSCIFLAQSTVVDPTRAFCGSSSQRAFGYLSCGKSVYKGRGLQRRHSGQCDFSSKDITLR